MHLIMVLEKYYKISYKRRKKGAVRWKDQAGQSTNILAIADGSSLLLAIHVESASPHEVTLMHNTLQASFVEGTPLRLIGDKAYASDPLDQALKEQGIEMIAPHRRKRTKPKTQDNRPLRRS